MKKSTAQTGLTIGTLTALLAGSLYAEMNAYDGFNVPDSYTHRAELDGESGGAGFNKWKVDTSENGSNSRRYIAVKDAPTYVDTKGNELQTEPGMMQCKSAGSGAGPLSRELKTEMTGTLWISFLTQQDMQAHYGWGIMFMDAEDEAQFTFMNGRDETRRWRIRSMKHPSGKQKDGLFESKEGIRPTDLTLVILKVENAGSDSNDGEVTAFLNPADLRDAELSAEASVSISGLTLNAIKKLSFDKGTVATGYIDELRFGTTIEDVLPMK